MRFGRRSRGPSGRGRDPWTAFMILQLAHRVIETPDKPPLTLCLLAANVLAYVRPKGTESYLPTLETGCLHPERVIWKGEWERMLLSAFLHVSDHHLYYNMASLLYKGTVLERELGTVAFGRLVAFILICSQSMYVAVSYTALLCGYPDWMYSRAAGFSGVLFGLKVILHSRSRGLHNVFGLKVSSRWASWVELVVIQFLFPSASFLGHACGIASGLLWLKLGRMACFWPSCALSTHRRFTGHGRANRTDPSPEAHSKDNEDCRRSQQSCTSSEADHRSTVQRLRRTSSSGAAHESPGGQLSANELRRRRLLYFDAQR